MIKHTLFFAGILFLSHHGFGQVSDSTLKAKAIEKMGLYANLLEYLASPSFNLTTKAEIERTIESDFLDNQEVRFYQDLNFQFGGAQQISALQYFTQLKVLYPNGARITTGEFEVSDIFYNEARDMYYLNFRCQRKFSGLNAMAKKEVNVNKVLDYQVKIMESGKFKIEIVGNHIAEGGINTPLGLDKTLAELNRKNIGAKINPQAEELELANASRLVADLRLKSESYQSMVDQKKNLN